jgi:hypothetical protein
VLGNGRLLCGSEEYGFLFYESIASNSDFQTHSGFSLGVENRAEPLRRILDLYGFNETEKTDFTEFWLAKLDAAKTYAMYVQDTERLDMVMPLKVSPAPENSFRLWFSFRVTEEIPEPPKIDPIKRGGLTVVEWGGFLLEND